MAIDPSISLGVRPPQIAPLQLQTPLDRHQKMLTLRHLMTQGQLGTLNLEQTRLENEALQEKARRTTAVANLFAGGKRPTDDQLRAVGGIEGAAAIKSLYDADKAQFDAYESANKDLVRRAQGIATLPEQQQAFAYKVQRDQLIRMNPALEAQLPPEYPGPAWIQSQMNTGLNTDQFFANIRADAEEKRKSALAPSQVEEAKAKAEEAVAKAKAAQLEHAVMVMPNTKDAWEKLWYPALPAAIKAEISPKYSSEEADRVRAMLVKPTAAEPGKDIPYRQDVLTQKIQIAQAGVPGTEGDAALIQSIRANPSLWQSLTPKTQERIAPTLAGQGFTQFGKPATDAERRVLNFYDRMVNATNTLEATTVDEKGNKVPSLEEWVEKLGSIGQGRLALAPDWGQTAEGQAYNQALRQFTEARLRKESGAVIGPNEFAESRRTFFPVPGDQPRVLEQKRKARAQLVQSMQEEAGAAYVEREGKKQRTGGQTEPGGAMPAGTPIEVNGKRYTYKGSGATDDIANYTEVKP